MFFDEAGLAAELEKRISPLPLGFARSSVEMTAFFVGGRALLGGTEFLEVRNNRKVKGKSNDKGESNDKCGGSSPSASSGSE